MTAQASKDTAPELALRKELWRRGVRGYRLDVRLPFDRRRRADLAWRGRQLAVFVDGCFWHMCPEHFRLPATNSGWWARKLQSNVERDRDTNEQLASLGWDVVRVWEHEDVQAAADRVEAAYRSTS